MRNIGQEVGHALQRLVRAPLFTAATVATLALTIGANVSIFAVAERVVLHPLPYPDSDRLIQLVHGDGVGMSAETYRHYATRARSLESLAIYDDTEVTVTGSGDPERVRIVRVTPSLGSVLRVPPTHGRWLTERDAAPGAPPVAVLSNGLWMRRHGGDLSVLGRGVIINGVSMEVIGIMPADFAFPDPDVQAWINDERLTRFEGAALITHGGVARLREGATIEDARTELTRLISDLPNAYPGSPRVARLAESLKLASPVSLKEATIGNVARALWILLASVGVVFLVACINVANLFLVRSDARRPEVAIRRALGAGGTDLARYFITESVILSVAGGVAGLALASVAVQFLVATGPATLPRLHEIRLDGYAVAFCAVITLAAGIVFGLIPILHQRSRTVLLHHMAQGSASAGPRLRVRHLLIGAQVAFALVLLVAAGLMVRSFQNLRSVDPGFNPGSTLTFRVGLPPSKYRDHGRIVAAHRDIREQLSTLPGVVAVGASNCLPLENERCVSSSLRIEGKPTDDTPRPGVWLHGVTAGFFESMGMRILRGRAIDAADFEMRQSAVVVNEALAEAHFPGEDPVGHRVSFGSAGDDGWGIIVGVVANTPTGALNESRAAAKLYMPMSVTDAEHLGGPNPTNVSFVVRTSVPPLTLVSSVRHALDAVDRDVPIGQLRTLLDILDRASAQMAFMMILLAIAATVAVTLGVVGIYGAVSYVVSQRTQEIGVRIALGAQPRTVIQMFLRQGGIVAVLGAAVGVAVAFGTGRFIESVLFNVSPRDPEIFGGMTVLLLTVALLACWVPARRAARLDPVSALRGN